MGDTDKERASIRAARWQEAIVVNLLGHLGQRRLSRREFALLVDLSEDQLSRLVNGESWLTLRHVTRFEQELNADLMAGTMPEIETRV